MNAHLCPENRARYNTTKVQAGFTRDVRKIGHYGTGDLEIVIDSDDAFERAKPLLIRSYNAG